MRKKVWISAAELTDELKDDPKYREQQAERERLRLETASRAEFVSKPVIRSLREAGFAIDQMEELVPRYAPLPEPAIRVLLHWLPRVQDERVQEMIVRALAATTEPFEGLPLARTFEASSSEALRTLPTGELNRCDGGRCKHCGVPASGEGSRSQPLALRGTSDGRCVSPAD